MESNENLYNANIKLNCKVINDNDRIFNYSLEQSTKNGLNNLNYYHIRNKKIYSKLKDQNLQNVKNETNYKDRLINLVGHSNLHLCFEIDQLLYLKQQYAL